MYRSLLCPQSLIHAMSVLIVLLAMAGCAQKQVHTGQETEPNQSTALQAPSSADAADQSSAGKTKSATALNAQKKAVACAECAAMGQEKERGKCYRLQPRKISKVKKGKKIITVTGRCDPQSIPYARCRSGFTSCQLGDTSPIGWFACAQKSGITSDLPVPGSIIVIGSHKDRGMPTGHVGYVEEVCPNGDGTYTLRVSHTNYDRQCHLDLDAKVLFKPGSKEASFMSGNWSSWAKNLKILGFITK